MTTRISGQWPRLLATLFVLGGQLLLGSCNTTGSQLWKQGADILDSVSAGSQSQLTDVEISSAFREALDIGTVNVVRQLGRENGFYRDPQIHIPLPDELYKMQKALRDVGLSHLLDDLELKLNRAAEVATPKAKRLFKDAIREMTFADIRDIYNGPDDAATRYFQRKMTPGLSREMRPIVKGALGEVGAIRAYDRAVGRYKALPFVPDVSTDLTDYVIERGLDGIFHYLAEEEAEIRENPVRWTSDLLRRVFGAR